MHAFWLVLTYDLLEARRIDDVIIKTFAFFFFNSGKFWKFRRYFTRLGEPRFRKKVLPRPWTVTLNRRKKEKPVSLLFFFLFVSVTCLSVAKFEIKRSFFVQFNSFLYKTNGLHVAVFSNRLQRTSKCRKNISDTREVFFDVICDLLLNTRTATSIC